MIFIYASLGIAMFTALGMIHQTSISLLTQGAKYDVSNNDYIKSPYKGIDKDFIEVLKTANNSWGEGNILCEKIINEVKNDSRFKNLKEYTNGIESKSSDSQFAGSCVLQDNTHRVIFTKSDSDFSHYSIFSCLLNNKIYCDFES